MLEIIESRDRNVWSQFSFHGNFGDAGAGSSAIRENSLSVHLPTAGTGKQGGNGQAKKNTEKWTL